MKRDQQRAPHGVVYLASTKKSKEMQHEST